MSVAQRTCRRLAPERLLAYLRAELDVPVSERDVEWIDALSQEIGRRNAPERA
jgi:hypothetical protein